MSEHKWIWGFLLVALALVGCDDDSSGNKGQSGRVGPEGGTVSVTGGTLDGATLVFPPGAVDENVTVTLTQGNITTFDPFNQFMAAPVGDVLKIDIMPVRGASTPPAMWTTGASPPARAHPWKWRFTECAWINGCGTTSPTCPCWRS